MNINENSLLSEIGFTKLESEIYLTLLEKSPATGYFIAQIIAKPVANTYKALDSLFKKGVVVSDDSGKNRLYSPLPIKEYLDQLERDFKVKRGKIEESMQKRKPPKTFAGIYRFENIDQVFERAIQALKNAKNIALVDASPKPLERIKETLIETAAAGVRVVLEAYAPVSLPGCEMVDSLLEKEVFEAWPGDWLNVIIDGREYIMAFFDKQKEKVHQAVWSKSLYLSLMIHNGFIAEFILAKIRRMLQKDASGAEVLKTVEDYRPVRTSALPAFKDFLNTFNGVI